jgi:cytochrome P450
MTNSPAIDQDYLLQPDNYSLDHLPGEWGLPVIGRSLDIQKDVSGFLKQHVAKYGQPSRLGLGLQRGVVITHPDHLQQVFLDTEHCFSSQMGYDKTVARYYGGSFIFQDFGEHKISRRIMQGAFKSSALKGYVDIMNPAVVENITDWENMKDFRWGKEIKTLLIDVGARVFFGIDGRDDDKLKRLEHAFFNINEKGLMAIVNWNFPGTKYHAGLKGKREIEQIIVEVIRERRKNPGSDLTSILCQERDDDGNLWPEESLVPHLSLLLFGAHDTTVGVTSNLMMYLADPKHHHLQDRLREHALALDIENPSMDDLNDYEEFEWAFYESLRLHPSASITMRRTIREVMIGERLIPANTLIYNMVQWAHRCPDYWSNPDEFDMERFSPERKEHKSHSFAYAPFGGGAHKCIGLHVAMMNTKLIMHHTLRKYRFDFVPGYKPGSRSLPLPMPYEYLPLKVTPV